MCDLFDKVELNAFPARSNVKFQNVAGDGVESGSRGVGVGVWSLYCEVQVEQVPTCPVGGEGGGDWPCTARSTLNCEQKDTYDARWLTVINYSCVIIDI